MPNRCVAGGCSSRSNLEKGLVLHAFPYFNDDRPEAKKRRRKWASFVCQKRAEWEPTKNSVLCSLHFKRSDYQRQFNMIDEETNRVWFIPRLVRDELGISAVPTVHAKSLTTTTSAGETSRSKRMVRLDLLNNKTEMIMKRCFSCSCCLSFTDCYWNYVIFVFLKSNAMQATTSDNLTTTCDQYQVSDDRENDCSISQVKSYEIHSSPFIILRCRFSRKNIVLFKSES